MIGMDFGTMPPKVYDDLWCDLCGEEPQAGFTQDGVGACNGCMVLVLDKIAEQAGATMVSPNRAQRRAMKAGFRRRKGYTR